MFKKIFILTIAVIFLISCQSGKEDAKKFSEEYTKTTDNLKIKQNKVKTRDEYTALKLEKKTLFEALLKKFEKSPAIEEIETLRSKVLMKLEKLDEAEKKIDAILSGKPKFPVEAKIVKIQILFEKEMYGDAYNIFKEIESQIKDENVLIEAYYTLSSEHKDKKVKEEYSNKFLNIKKLPEEYAASRWEMYFNLASIAKEEGDLVKARKVLNDGIADTKDDRDKVILQKTLEQFDYYGQKAFPLTPGTWINTASPLVLDQLKGKVTLVFFWAPWCPSCRAITPTVIELFNTLKDQGLTVIGSTKLYGNYRDEVIKDKGKVNKAEEIELIKKYVERHKIGYPIVINEDKINQENYKISVIPVIVFINKKGEINFTKIGSGGEQFVKDKVKELLAEK